MFTDMLNPDFTEEISRSVGKKSGSRLPSLNAVDEVCCKRPNKCPERLLGPLKHGQGGAIIRKQGIWF